MEPTVGTPFLNWLCLLRTTHVVVAALVAVVLGSAPAALWAQGVSLCAPFAATREDAFVVALPQHAHVHAPCT